MSVDPLAIDLQHVTKTYRGRITALSELSLRVHRGEIFGLLGPNGAGKSTLIKIMMTLVRPTRCQGTLLGRPVGEKATLYRVGYLPENHRFPRYLTGGQVLDLFGALVGVKRRDRRRRSDKLLDLVGMLDWKNKRVASYSKGMMQRVGLAAAMMGDPDLLLLDEPTDGVDPAGRKQIREVLADFRRRGKAVFINSHQLGELEHISDRVAILIGGRVSRQGTLDELALDKGTYHLQIDADLNDAAVRGQIEAMIQTQPGWEVRGDAIVRPTLDPALVQPMLDALRAANLTVRRLQPVRPSLEDLYMEAVADTTGQGYLAGARPAGKDSPLPAPPPFPNANANRRTA